MPRRREDGHADRLAGESSDGWKRGEVRRPADILSALLGLLGLVLLLVSVHGLPAGTAELSKDAASLGRVLPHWLAVGGSLLALALTFVIAIVVMVTLFRSDTRRAVNAVTAAALSAAAALMAAALWNGERGTVDKIVLHGSNPSSLVYGSAFVAFLTGSDLVRRGRWTRWCVLSTASLFLFNVASRALAPYGVPVALLGGAAIGWLTRWSLGTTPARPTPQKLTSALEAVGIDITLSGDGAGPRDAVLAGELAGEEVEVRIADRDTRGARLFQRLWAFLRLRPAVAGRPLASSRERLERLALASSLAEQRGAAAPKVLALREVEDALVLVSTVPAGAPLGQDLGPDDVGKLFSALALLHASGVAHRDLRPRNLALEDGVANFRNLDSAEPGAPDLLLRLDVVQLLTTAASRSSPLVAIGAMRDSYRPLSGDDEKAIASVLQPVALAPWGWSEMRAARECLDAMRRELVGEAQLLETSLVRFRWRTVLTTAALIAAAFVLVGQLSKVDLAGALARANLFWCLVAIAGSAAGIVAAAGNLAAFVPERLSLLRGSAVQLAASFLGIAAPPTVGHVAVNARYLHRQGLDQSTIAAAVALSQIVNVVTTVLLLLVIGVLTGSGVSRFELTPSPDLLMAIGAVGVLVAVLLLIPRTRAAVVRSVWPRVRNIWPHLLEAFSAPIRVALGAGANLLLTATYVVALVASVRAVGGHPTILATTVVFLAANTVGTAAPTPGGVGAVEAALSAGLSAIGIPVHVGIPAVLIFRLATYWLPIPAGWVAYVVLQRRRIL